MSRTLFFTLSTHQNHLHICINSCLNPSPASSKIVHIFPLSCPDFKVIHFAFEKCLSSQAFAETVFDPISLDIWDPFANNNFFNSALSNKSAQFTNARIDWKETLEAHVFKAGLPGLKKEEVNIEVEVGKVLQISEERNKEQEEKSDRWHRLERSSGKFSRRFRLPENAKVEEVRAAMENGVLTVTVSKVEEKKPEVKAIEISG